MCVSVFPSISIQYQKEWKLINPDKISLALKRGKIKDFFFILISNKVNNPTQDQSIHLKTSEAASIDIVSSCLIFKGLEILVSLLTVKKEWKTQSQETMEGVFIQKTLFLKK